MPAERIRESTIQIIRDVCGGVVAVKHEDGEDLEVAALYGHDGDRLGLGVGRHGDGPWSGIA